MADAVLFDLDGTLVDSSNAVTWCVNELLRRLGRPPVTQEQVVPLIGVGLLPLLKHFIDDPEPYVELYRHIYSEHFQDHTSVYTDVKDMLKALKLRGIKTAIVTNRNVNLAWLIVNHFKLDQYIDALVGQRDGVKLKPDPSLIYEACTELKVDPSNAIMVGDTEIDMETAHNAGSFGIKIVRMSDMNGSSADIVVSDLNDIIGYA